MTNEQFRLLIKVLIKGFNGVMMAIMYCRPNSGVLNVSQSVERNLLDDHEKELDDTQKC